jgi:hypothetical protein
MLSTNNGINIPLLPASNLPSTHSASISTQAIELTQSHVNMDLKPAPDSARHSSFFIQPMPTSPRTIPVAEEDQDAALQRLTEASTRLQSLLDRVKTLPPHLVAHFNLTPEELSTFGHNVTTTLELLTATIQRMRDRKFNAESLRPQSSCIAHITLTGLGAYLPSMLGLQATVATLFGAVQCFAPTAIMSSTTNAIQLGFTLSAPVAIAFGASTCCLMSTLQTISHYKRRGGLFKVNEDKLYFSNLKNLITTANEEILGLQEALRDPSAAHESKAIAATTTILSPSSSSIRG